ncbi:hypothetical protein Tco_0371280, partial [Tanacetum coccineum]
LGDRMERAATTASSLEAEQESCNINKIQSMATLNGSITAAELLTTVRHHLVLPVQVNAAEVKYCSSLYRLLSPPVITEVVVYLSFKQLAELKDCAKLRLKKIEEWDNVQAIEGHDWTMSCVKVIEQEKVKEQEEKKKKKRKESPNSKRQRGKESYVHLFEEYGEDLLIYSEEFKEVEEIQKAFDKTMGWIKNFKPWFLKKGKKE